VLSAYALLLGWRGNVLAVILQPFVLQLGASVAFLGLLETIGGYRGLVPAVVQPFGGWMADRVGRKAVAVAAGSASVVSLLLFTLAGRVQTVGLLLPAAALLGLGSIGRPATDALVGESAGPQVGYAYSRVTFAWTLAGIVAVAAGYLADLLGFPPIFALTAGLEALSTTLLALLVQETVAGPHPTRPRPAELQRLTLDALTPPRRLRAFYLGVVIDTFGYGLGSVLLFGFLADKYGFNPFQFGVMTTIYSGAWALAQLPAGRWTDQGRARHFLILSEGLTAVTIASWLLTSRFEVFAASMALSGLASALWTPALMSWAYARIPEGRRAEELGRLNAVPSVYAFPAPWIGGFLYERLGFVAPIGLSLVGTVVAGIVFAWALRD
jgi:DHA1 family multidrug resistance protein-like MFS transporter